MKHLILKQNIKFNAQIQANYNSKKKKNGSEKVEKSECTRRRSHARVSVLVLTLFSRSFSFFNSVWLELSRSASGQFKWRKPIDIGKIVAHGRQ